MKLAFLSDQKIYLIERLLYLNPSLLKRIEIIIGSIHIQRTAIRFVNYTRISLVNCGIRQCLSSNSCKHYCAQKTRSSRTNFVDLRCTLSQCIRKLRISTCFVKQRPIGVVEIICSNPCLHKPPSELLNKGLKSYCKRFSSKNSIPLNPMFLSRLNPKRDPNCDTDAGDAADCLHPRWSILSKIKWVNKQHKYERNPNIKHLDQQMPHDAFQPNVRKLFHRKNPNFQEAQSTRTTSCRGHSNLMIKTDNHVGARL